jgi:hypothetical protein
LDPNSIRILNPLRLEWFCAEISFAIIVKPKAIFLIYFLVSLKHLLPQLCSRLLVLMKLEDILDELETWTESPAWLLAAATFFISNLMTQKANSTFIYRSSYAWQEMIELQP